MLRFFSSPYRRDVILWSLLIVYLAVVVILAIRDPEMLVFYRNSICPKLSGSAVGIMSVTYIYLLATGICCCFYRPVKTVADDDKLPACTVIVPAYNEGCHVERTIKSLLASDYPADKLQIIAINDGSADDTWE